MTKPPCVAFLGPEGTYSHQAAYELFGNGATYVPQRTITDTFLALGSELPFALLPWENSIHGIVGETLDLLRSEEVGTSIHVRGEKVIGVQHCMLVRKGVQLSEVKSVLSHEQALGQCSSYLSKHLPNAARIKVTSTALAAESVSAGQGEDACNAAIASSICGTLFPGLEIVAQGIQDVQENFTRFILLSTLKDVPLPVQLQEEPNHRQAIIRFAISQSGPANFVDVLSIFRDGSGCSISRIDRRPCQNGEPFDDVYFLVVRGPDLHGGGGIRFNPLSIYLDNVMIRLKIILNQSRSKPALLGTW